MSDAAGWPRMKNYASFTGLAGERVTVHEAAATDEPSVWLVGDRGADNNGALRLNGRHAIVVRDALNRWLEDIGAERQGHVIEFREDGWTILHPLSCRPKLFDCPVNRVAERELTQPPGTLGRFECKLNDGDRLSIGDRVEGPDGYDVQRPGLERGEQKLLEVMAERTAAQDELGRVDAAEAVLVAHQRHRGGCLCGWAELGQSLPGHQVAMLREAGLLKGSGDRVEGARA